MKGSTHYIEHYKNVETGREYTSPIREIKDLAKNLKLTGYPLKTIQVNKIKFKPGVMIVEHDTDLGVTIIEKG